MARRRLSAKEKKKALRKAKKTSRAEARRQKGLKGYPWFWPDNAAAGQSAQAGRAAPTS